MNSCPPIPALDGEDLDRVLEGEDGEDVVHRDVADLKVAAEAPRVDERQRHRCPRLVARPSLRVLKSGEKYTGSATIFCLLPNQSSQSAL